MPTRQSYVHALKGAGLLDSDSNDGAFSKRMHRFGERDIGLHALTNKLQNEDLKPSPPTTHQQTKHIVYFASRHKR
jgi:hypothetical protein